MKLILCCLLCVCSLCMANTLADTRAMLVEAATSTKAPHEDDDGVMWYTNSYDVFTLPANTTTTALICPDAKAVSLIFGVTEVAKGEDFDYSLSVGEVSGVVAKTYSTADAEIMYTFETSDIDDADVGFELESKDNCLVVMASNGEDVSVSVEYTKASTTTVILVVVSVIAVILLGALGALCYMLVKARRVPKASATGPQEAPVTTTL
ncbi:hypothetical protein KIPB_000351 [Kipferlia bialata]|uniref:Uncharacterized protein n=1 Tax=Kipferlia bialata TaxID=797122 RepID=A0A391NL83_9EUKA|nr:hypothetical protein KIPB_000351 [Kipferlia bialata]|eukprot:g351.t1